MSPIGIVLLIIMSIYNAYAIYVSYYSKKAKQERLKRKNLPICYHCESKDTLGYYMNIFYCTFCGRTIDSEHVLSNYPEDAEYVAKGKEQYELYKKQGSVE